MIDIETGMAELAGSGAPPDLQRIDERAGARLRRRRLTFGSAAAVCLVAAGAAFLALGGEGPDQLAVEPPASRSDASSEVPSGPCEGPEFEADGVPTEGAATRLVEQFLAQRSTGGGADACLTSAALDTYRAGEATGASILCLYFDSCADGRRVVETDLVSAGSFSESGVRLVTVRLAFDDGTTVQETPQIEARPVPSGRLLKISGVEASAEDESSAQDVEQLVRSAFDALAAGDWPEATEFFFAGGASVGDPSVEWGEEVDQLMAADPDLVASGDVAAILQAWCEQYSGACFEVDEVVGVESSGDSQLVSVRLRSPAGEAVRFADGSDVAQLSLGDFEGLRWIADLPPQTG